MFLKDRGHHDGRPVQAMTSSPSSLQPEKAPQSIKDPEQPKVIKKTKPNHCSPAVLEHVIHETLVHFGLQIPGPYSQRSC